MKKRGIDAIIYHAVFNESRIVHLKKWQDLHGNTKLPLYVDVETNRQNIEFIITLQPHVIVIDHAITQSKNPAQEAEFYLNAMHNAQL